MKTPPSPVATRPLGLLELLLAIKKRPMMYIGDRAKNRCSIWHLKSFIVGFQSGRIGTGVHQEGDDVLDAFTFWICLRFHVPDGPLDWSGLLWKQCGKDDEAAFRMFFDLLDEYLKDRAELGHQVIKARFIELIVKIRERGGS